MKKRVVALLMCGVVASTALVGCGEKKEDTKTPQVTDKVGETLETMVDEASSVVETVTEEESTEVTVEDEIGQVFTYEDLGQLIPNDFIAVGSVDVSAMEGLDSFDMTIGKYEDNVSFEMAFSATADGETQSGMVGAYVVDGESYFAMDLGDEDSGMYKVASDGEGGDLGLGDEDFLDMSEFEDEDYTLIVVDDESKIYELSDGTTMTVDRITGYATQMVQESEDFGTVTLNISECYGVEDLVDVTLFDGAEEISADDAGMALMTPLMVLMMGGTDMSFSTSDEDYDLAETDDVAVDVDVDAEMLYDEVVDVYYTENPDSMTDYRLYTSDSASTSNGQIDIYNGEVSGHFYMGMSDDEQAEFEAKADAFIEAHK